MSSTESILILVKREGMMKVYTDDIDEYNMFAKDKYGSLDDEWLPDFEPLKEDGFYLVYFGYGGFYEGTNPHGNKKIYYCKRMCGLDGVGEDLLGGPRFLCLSCNKIYRSTDGVHHICPKCKINSGCEC